MYKQEIQN